MDNTPNDSTYIETTKKTETKNPYPKPQTHKQTEETTITIPTEYSRHIMGRAGRKQKEIESNYNIKIHISPDIKNNTQTITLRGEKRATQQGKQEIIEIIEIRKERDLKQNICRYYQQGYCRK